MNFYKTTYGYKKKMDNKWLVLGDSIRTLIVIAEDYENAVIKIKESIESLNYGLDTEKYSFYHHGQVEKLTGLIIDYNSSDGIPVFEGIVNRKKEDK